MRRRMLTITSVISMIFSNRFLNPRGGTNIRDIAPAVSQQGLCLPGDGHHDRKTLLRRLTGGIGRSPASLTAGRDAKVCIAQGIMFPGPTAGALAAVFALRSVGAIPSRARGVQAPEEPLADRTDAPAPLDDHS